MGHGERYIKSYSIIIMVLIILNIQVHKIKDIYKVRYYGLR